jgi:hypothetical protein
VRELVNKRSLGTEASNRRSVQYAGCGLMSALPREQLVVERRRALARRSGQASQTDMHMQLLDPGTELETIAISGERETFGRLQPASGMNDGGSGGVL